MGVDPWCLEQLTMDAAFSSAWGFPEGNLEELKQKLLCATVELEALRANAKEEMRKIEENMEHLIHLLQVITRERDAARHQLQLLLTRLTAQEPWELCPQARSSGSLTESDSHSLGASPVESLFENNAVSSPPESSSLKMAINGSSDTRPALGKVSAVIDGLAVKKPLPQKGKFLQAVLEAGPTLQTLLLAGPLPQWRNPPPLQPLQLPPLPVEARNASMLSKPIHGSSPNDFSHGQRAMKRSVVSACFEGYENLCVKRQRMQCSGRT